MPIVEELAGKIGHRLAGTEGARRGGEYLVRRLEEIPGLEVEVQDVVAFRGRVRFRVRNVLARLRGEEPGALLVSAHYDSAVGSLGAAEPDADLSGIAWSRLLFVATEAASEVSAEVRLAPVPPGQSGALPPEDLDAIIVTHEHSDHIRGVGILSRRYRLPVYINPQTHKACPRIGKLHETRTFECGTTFHINKMVVPFWPMVKPAGSSAS